MLTLSLSAAFHFKVYTRDKWGTLVGLPSLMKFLLGIRITASDFLIWQTTLRDPSFGDYGFGAFSSRLYVTS